MTERIDHAAEAMKMMKASLSDPVVAGILFLVLTLIGLVIVIASLISWYVSS